MNHNIDISSDSAHFGIPKSLRGKIQVKLLPNYFPDVLNIYSGTAVEQWLRCCATNRKVTVSIPDGVIGIFR